MTIIHCTTSPQEPIMAIDTRDLTVHHLTTLAECGSPSTDTSPGAEMLINVRDAVVVALDYVLADGQASNLAEAVDIMRNHGGATAEIADGAPSVYTGVLWEQFVDLAAYREDPTEIGADASDMNGAAGVCLYIIAERLVSALLDHLETSETR